MKSITALELRQSLRNVVRMLEKNGDPVLLQRGKRPVAVLISLKDFQERFVDKAAAEERTALLNDIDALARPSKDRTPAEELLRNLRRA